MSWPTSPDYNQSVQNPGLNFADPELRRCLPVTNPLGVPLPASGNFADVYQLRHAGSGRRWAVKCFTRPALDLKARYAEIGRHLAAARLPFTVGFQYLEQGVRVGGRWYPVVKMEWVEGQLFNHFVGHALDRPKYLDDLALMWRRMAARLREFRIAHGDLQHGNVLLVAHEAGKLHLKLIDYDGLFVPGLAGAPPSPEVGHPAYQHPLRYGRHPQGPELDRFSVLLVAAALRCVRVAGASLWPRYDNGENLLFREADLKNPDASPLFAELSRLDDPLAVHLTRTLAAACRGPLEQVPLLEEALAAAPAPVTRALPKLDLEPLPNSPGRRSALPGAPTLGRATRAARENWPALAAAGVLAAVVLCSWLFFKLGRAPAQGPELGSFAVYPGQVRSVAVAMKEAAERDPAFRFDGLPEHVTARVLSADPDSGKVEIELAAAGDAAAGETVLAVVATSGGRTTRYPMTVRVAHDAGPLVLDPGLTGGNAKGPTPPDGANTGGPGTPVDPPKPAAPTFVQVADRLRQQLPEKLALAPGESRELTLKIPRDEGFLDQLEFTVTGLPAGVAVPPLNPVAPTEAAVTLTFAADKGAPPAAATVAVAVQNVRDEQARFDLPLEVTPARPAAQVVQAEVTAGEPLPLKLEAYDQVAVSPDAKTAAAVRPYQIHFFDAATGKEAAAPKLDSLVRAAAFHPGGQTLYVATADGKCRPVPPAPELPPLEIGSATASALAFSADGKLVAAWAAGALKLFDGRTGAARPDVPTGDKQVVALALPADGRFALTGTAEGEVVCQRLDGKPATKLDFPEPKLTALAVSPDGKTAALAGEKIHLRDPATGAAVHTLERPDAGPVLDLAFAPDGKRLLSVHGKGTLCLWDAADGKLLWSWASAGTELRRAAIAQDLTTVAAAATTGELRLWQIGWKRPGE